MARAAVRRSACLPAGILCRCSAAEVAVLETGKSLLAWRGIEDAGEGVVVEGSAELRPASARRWEGVGEVAAN